MTGDFAVGKVDLNIEALIRNQKVITVGEKKGIGIGTDKRGFEPQVALAFFRQALDTTPGAVQLRRWELKVFPALLAISIEQGFTEAPQETKYVLRPQFSYKHLWGTTFNLTDDGFLRAQETKWVTEFKPKIVGFIGDGTTTVFNLPTAYPAQATTKIDLWVNGVKTTSGITLATTSITFTVAPANNTNITVFYEYSV